MKTILVLVAMIFASCNAQTETQPTKASSPTPVAHQSSDGVKRVTIAELDELMKQGNVVVVDVRNKDAYDRGHIPGAKLIPVGEVGQRFKELPRDKTIVTYCS